MEDVFDLRGFILTVLRRWRLVLFLILLGGILGGLIRLFPGLGQLSGQENDPQYQREKEIYNRQVQALEREILQTEISLDSMQEYMRESILMRIPAYGKPIGVLSFYISGLPGQETLTGTVQAMDSTGRLVMAFAQALEGGDLYSFIRQRIENFSESRYFGELVSVSYQAYSGLVTIEVTGEDMRMCRQLLAMLEEYVEGKSRQFQSDIAPHRLNVITNSWYTQADPELDTFQKSKVETLAGREQQLQDRQTQLEQLQPPLFPTLGNVVKESFLFSVLGAVGGAGLAVLLVFFIDLMDTRVTDEWELEKRFGLPVLGTVEREREKDGHWG